MTHRTLHALLALVLLTAACGRGDSNADSARADSAATDSTAGTRSLAEPISEPPPPPIDTVGTLRFDGGAAADSASDSLVVAFHYDSTANGLEVTFTVAQRDSVTVSEGAYIRAGGKDGATGQGTITARTRRGVLTANLAQDIRGGSALTKCLARSNPGQGRCGQVILEVRWTPTGGRETRRRVRFDLGD